MTIVSDSSPLISLSDIGLLETLYVQVERVEIPSAVEREVFRAGRVNRELPPWISVTAVRDQPLVEMLTRSVDPGEAEAIALAEQLRVPLLIDDLPGRALAVSRGLVITGTLGLLLECKRSGLIPRLAPVLEELRAAEFRMSDPLMDQILRAAGEH